MREKKNRSIELDLTSFIDVLFVILIAIIFLYAQLNKQPYEPTPITTSPDIEDLVSIVLVIEYDEENVENRTIRMESDQGIEFAQFSMLEGESEEAYETLQAELSKVLEQYADVPVLLSMYENRILYRDHKMVEEIIEGFKDNDNFYPTWKENETMKNDSENSNE